ncbi:M3 family oligoendopeptidase [Macrococcus hajekii]|uniref:M3 family oligoendopeptidase n=1 Tax=Macrococcus hajekii TaxID=198482 RepID=A0A4R6BIC5_9STAP|nr:M3 family oligoendopeptidase [Macrococcus hajekii]TDM01375.1 M3 family oligoendopeptidase [Macrococcus hajekii]GGB11076.1 oligoendopeptidase F [Macrococcus hajekii]
MTTFKDFQYQRPDLNQARQTVDELLEQFRQATSAEQQIQLISDINDIRKDIDTNLNIAYSRASIDTSDQYYSDERDYFDDNGAKIVAIDAVYFEALLTSEYREELESHYGKQLFDLAYNVVHSYSDEVEELINQENKLSSDYSKLIASAQIQFDGKELTLAQMSPYTQSPDRETRIAATQAVQGFMGEHLDDIDAIYDQLVKVRHQIALTLGFDNFIELGYMRMQRIDYNQEMVASFRRQIEEFVVPVANRLYEQQAERIGVDKLKFYDEGIMFLNGNEDPKDSAEVILENGRKMYHELSPETDEFYQYMMEHELFDVIAKKGKEGGGYCTYIDRYRAPFIFANFNTTDHDITVLTHEAGHAFQVYSSRDVEVPDYIWPTHEACEIHSMSMEFFTYPWLDLFFSNADKFKYKHLTDAIQFLPYGVAVDEFQHGIYENPELTPSERRSLWKSIEEKYLPHRDYDGIMPIADGSYWHRQGHIFNSPFYYIDYTLAQVCAFQFFRRSRQDFASAWQDYLHLCHLGGSLPFNALVDEANLASPFGTGTLKDIMVYLENYIEHIDASEF